VGTIPFYLGSSNGFNVLALNRATFFSVDFSIFLILSRDELLYGLI